QMACKNDSRCDVDRHSEGKARYSGEPVPRLGLTGSQSTSATVASFRSRIPFHTEEVRPMPGEPVAQGTPKAGPRRKMILTDESRVGRSLSGQSRGSATIFVLEEQATNGLWLPDPTLDCPAGGADSGEGAAMSPHFWLALGGLVLLGLIVLLWRAWPASEEQA